MRTTIPLVFSLAATVIVFSPTMAVAQTPSMGEITTATSFIDRLRGIMDICTRQVQSDAVLSIACTNIVNDFNAHMAELFDEEQNNIGQVMLSGNQ